MGKGELVNITIVGLGKLGAPIAAAIASRGHDVIGIDKNQEVVDKINKGIPPVDEPHLEQTMKLAGKNFRAFTKLSEGVHGADIIGVLVPTPSMKSGYFSHEHVLNVCRAVGRRIRGTVAYGNFRLISVMSTLTPGTMENVIRPAMESAIGTPCGDGWELTYNPELVAIGNVIEDYLNPDLVIVGQSDEQAGIDLSNFLLSTMKVEPQQIHCMSFTNAEIVKMSINMFVSAKIAFANILGDLCEKFPFGDVDAVCAAIGADSRIGRKYFTAGMPYGGTCFPRDVQAFEVLCDDNKTRGEVAWAVHRANKFRARKIMNLVRRWCNVGSTVAILGLSYKPYTSCTIGSPSLIVAEQLNDKGYNVVGYDERVDPNDLPETVEFWTLQKCLDEADVIVIANPEVAFERISQSDFRRRKRLGTIVDCWRILRGRIQDTKKIRIRFVGVGPEESK